VVGFARGRRGGKKGEKKTDRVVDWYGGWSRTTEKTGKREERERVWYQRATGGPQKGGLEVVLGKVKKWYRKQDRTGWRTRLKRDLRRYQENIKKWYRKQG
jgi:hypothetical protein